MKGRGGRATRCEADLHLSSKTPAPARQSGGNIYLDTISSNVLRNQTPIYNFAVGANPVNYSRAQFSQQYIVQGPVKDFRDQQAQFEILNRNKAALGWNSTNSLFISFFGINDVAVQIYSGRNSASVYEPILRADVADYWSLIERQYRLGGRRFLTVLVPREYSLSSTFSASFADHTGP